MQKNECIAYTGVQVQFTLLCTQIRWGELWRILLKIHNKINTPPQNSTEQNSNTISAPMHSFCMDCDDVPFPTSPSSYLYLLTLPLLLNGCAYPLLLLRVRAKFYQRILEWVIHIWEMFVAWSASTHTQIQIQRGISHSRLATNGCTASHCRCPLWDCWTVAVALICAYRSGLRSLWLSLLLPLSLPLQVVV